MKHKNLQITHTDENGNIISYKAIKVATKIGTGSHIILPKSLVGRTMRVELEEEK